VARCPAYRPFFYSPLLLFAYSNNGVIPSLEFQTFSRLRLPYFLWPPEVRLAELMKFSCLIAMAKWKVIWCPIKPKTSSKLCSHYRVESSCNCRTIRKEFVIRTRDLRGERSWKPFLSRTLSTAPPGDDDAFWMTNEPSLPLLCCLNRWDKLLRS